MRRQSLPPPAEVAAYILGGGASRRMGTSKVALSHEGHPLVLTLAERLQPHVSEVVVVLKESQHAEVAGLRSIFDSRPERAVVHGLRTALDAPGPVWRFVLACDMPGVEADLLGLLWNTARDADAPGACVHLAGAAHPEPFPALWHRDVGKRIESGWGLTARHWLHHAQLAVYALAAPAGDSLANLNTPEEWKRWQRTQTRGVER